MAVQTTTPAARPGFGTRIGAFFSGLPQGYDNVRSELRKVTRPDLP